MRNFHVVNKWGCRVRTLKATGNIQALCNFLEYSGNGLPDVPMHTVKGVLLANVNGNIYAVFDAQDKPDLEFLHAASVNQKLSGLQIKTLTGNVKRLLQHYHKTCEVNYVV